MNTNKTHLNHLILSALFLALAYILPFFTGNIPQIGSMLLPMHIPVLLCGFVCGAPWGLAVGMIAPVMRSLLTGGFPPMFPTAVAMAFELATYGFTAGFFSRRLANNLCGTYATLLLSMLCGRVVWGFVMALLTLNASSFSLSVFVAGAFTNAIPGIILQLVAIPAIVIALGKTTKSPAEV